MELRPDLRRQRNNFKELIDPEQNLVLCLKIELAKNINANGFSKITRCESPVLRIREFEKYF